MDATRSYTKTASLASLIFLFSFLLLRKYTKKKSTLPLPPSPKSYPIIGNLLDLPPANVRAAEWWEKHKALYGKYQV